jgi:K+-sensing histidine kinase KdpD
VRTRPLSLLLRPTPPPAGIGLLVAAAFVAVETLLAFPLREVAPATSLGVVYLIGVLVVSTAWGSVLGAVTSVASALAFNFFHIPPTGRFTIAIGQNWVALGVFLAVALLASSVADLARARAAEAWERRREADLAAEMARLLLRTDDLRSALPAAAQRLARALDLPSAAIELDEVAADPRRVPFPLRDGTTPLGTLIVPADTPEAGLRRIQERVVPSLEALLAAALDRDLPLIRADAAQLERAIANVLDNGVRHSGGHPVSVRARAVGGRLLMRVVDRGPGVPPAQRERIFEPFYRAGTEGSGGHRGSGLGLAIARGLVTVNGGRIWVESLPGQGTTFAMEFPLEPSGSRPAAPVGEAAG